MDIRDHRQMMTKIRIGSLRALLNLEIPSSGKTLNLHKKYIYILGIGGLPHAPKGAWENRQGDWVPSG